MKTITLTLLFFAFAVNAEVWKKPAYTPDENHLPPSEKEYIPGFEKQAEEERPDPKLEPGFEKQTEREEFKKVEKN